MKRLYRSRDEQVIGGVCMGLSHYFDVDVTLIRLIWVVLALVGGSGVLAYFIAWIIIPEGSESGEVIEVSQGSSSTGVSGDTRTIGMVVIAIGVFLLLRNFFNIQFFRFYFWPIALVLLGVFIMFGGLRGAKR